MFLVFLLIILLVLAGTLIVVSVQSTGDRKSSLDRAILLITVPQDLARKEDEFSPQTRDFKELVAVADQLFSSLSSLRQPNVPTPVLSLEIVTENDRISFYLTCPKGLVSQIEKQLHAFYPHAQIERVFGHNIFSVEEGAVAIAVLALTKRFIFPIRTYKLLDTEPLSAITNVLSKMGQGGAAAVQLVIQPIPDRWRVATQVAAKHVLDGKHTYIYSSGWLRTFHAFLDLVQTSFRQSVTTRPASQLTQEQGKTMLRLTPAQEELMKAFAEKGARVGFKTTVRIVSVAPTEEAARVHLHNIVSAYAQFAAPAWNSFRVITKVSRPAEVLNFIFRRLGETPKMILNSEELASVFHLPNRFVETPTIQWLLSRTLPPPTNLPTIGVVMGESRYRGETKLVRIKDEDRLRHIFMIGKTGVGKTTLFENMIDQDIRAGKGVCFIDPLGDAIESILAKIPEQRAEEVILFDPSDTERPMGLNLLEWRQPEDKDRLIADWIEIFYKLYDPNRTGIIGPQWEHWGRNAALTVMAQPEGGTLIEIPRLFVDDQFREQAISYVKDPVVQAFWKQQLAKTADFHKSEMYNYFISKFGRFMTNDLMRNVIGQTKSAFDLREVLDSGKILLINLAKGKIGELNASLLGLILVSKLQIAAFSRADTPEDQRRPFYLYIDEFQNFTTDTFATILSEARKYKLSLNITNQFIAQLTENIRNAVIGNAGTIIVYRIGAQDAEYMVKEFPGVTIDDLVNLDRFTTYVKLLLDLTPTKPFSMTGVKSPIPKNNQVAEAIRQLSRLKFGKDKAVVEREIGQRTQVLDRELAVASGANEPLAKV